MLLLMPMVGKELVVLLLVVLLQQLVLVGDRPPLPPFMGRALQQVVLQLMLLLMLLLMQLWELRLPRRARALLLVLVPVPVGRDMRLVVGSLVVLLKVIVLARARLLLHVLVDIEL
jgi:hypothetical protein